MNFDIIDQIDRQATLAINGSDSIFWDNIIYTVTNTFSWSMVILALLIVIFKNNTPRESLLILLFIALLIFVADRLCSGIVKPTVARWRPTQNPDIMYMIDVVRNYRGGRFGFFSGHACNTFCMATFLTMLFRTRNVGIVLYFWAATTTYTRLYLGVHYLGDVTVGMLVGITLGYLFYLAYSRCRTRLIGRKRLISEQFTPTGYMRSDIDAFLSIVFFNYVCVVIFATARGI